MSLAIISVYHHPRLVCLTHGLSISIKYLVVSDDEYLVLPVDPDDALHGHGMGPSAGPSRYHGHGMGPGAIAFVSINAICEPPQELQLSRLS